MKAPIPPGSTTWKPMDTDLDIPYSVPQVKFVQKVVRPIGMLPNKKKPKQKGLPRMIWCIYVREKAVICLNQKLVCEFK